MSSWGHAIRLATERERCWSTPIDGTFKPDPAKPKFCKAPRCSQPGRYFAHYAYPNARNHLSPCLVRRLLCFHHALRFANNFELALPDDPEHPGRVQTSSVLCPPSSVL